MDANWWNNALQSYDVGRSHRADRENATAFQSGGLDAVADTAGRRGDLQGMETARTMTRRQRQFEDDERQNAYERMEQIAPLARGALQRARQLPPERRAQFFNAPHIRQRFEDFGIPPEQYDAAVAGLAGPEAEQWFTELDAAFSQHQNPEWQVSPYTGQAQAVTPDGQFITGGMSPDAERIAEAAQIEMQNNRRVASGIGLSGGGGSGGRAPSGYRWTADGGALEPIPGGPRDPESQGARPFPADQRARVAISFDPALEAAQQMEAAESGAVQRQGSHGSNTPFGQDWGARFVEGIVPWDGGSAARFVGGEDYQQYVRASSAFEAAILPILSGAAVTESEAQRIVRAALPRLNDSRETLQMKARQRRQMLNGAALIGGRPMPYPDDAVASWAERANNALQQSAPSGIGIESLTDEQLDQLEQELMNAQP